MFCFGAVLGCVLLLSALRSRDAMVREPKKDPQNQQNRTNNAKEFSEQFEGATGPLPIKTRVLRQIAPESSPESSAKSLSQKFFGVPFLSLNGLT